MPYEILSHTADTGIEATGAGLAELIDELAKGMFALIATVDPCPAPRRIDVEVSAATPEDLVVDLLSDLLYESEIEDVMPCDFSTTMLGATHARVTAGGAPLSDVETTGPPIKAVTYHDLTVEERDDHWFGRVYFDV